MILPGLKIKSVARLAPFRVNYSGCFLAKFRALAAMLARSHNHHTHHRDLAGAHSTDRSERRASPASHQTRYRSAAANFRCFGNDSVLSFLVFPHLKLRHGGSLLAVLGSPRGSPTHPARGTTPQLNGGCAECHKSVPGTFWGSYGLIRFPCRNRPRELSGQSVGLSRQYCGNPSDELL